MQVLHFVQDDKIVILSEAKNLFLDDRFNGSPHALGLDEGQVGG